MRFNISTSIILMLYENHKSLQIRNWQTWVHQAYGANMIQLENTMDWYFSDNITLNWEYHYVINYYFRPKKRLFLYNNWVVSRNNSLNMEFYCKIYSAKLYHSKWTNHITKPYSEYYFNIGESIWSVPNYLIRMILVILNPW